MEQRIGLKEMEKMGLNSSLFAISFIIAPSLQLLLVIEWREKESDMN